MDKQEKIEYLYYIQDKSIKKTKVNRENKTNYIVESSHKNQLDIVNKKTMLSGTKKRYYTHPFLAKESYFLEKNAYNIGKKLQSCKNPFLLRQIAHNLEMEDEILDINYIEGEN